MPKITIEYEDDTDTCPHTAIAAVLQAAAEHLPVTAASWHRDHEQDDSRYTHVHIHPDPWRALTEPHWRSRLSQNAMKAGR